MRQQYFSLEIRGDDLIYHGVFNYSKSSITMSAILDRIRNFFGQNDSSIGYIQAKKLAGDKNPNVRKELAERRDMKPEILYFLADDPDPNVRREIAKNRATPRQADAVLANDTDDEVRSCLAEKIARLTPQLNSIEREDIRIMTVEILERLARDQVPKIRQILADTLKDVADAPPGVIRKLAEDDELYVSVPVLENSPVLTDDDLLQLISSLPVSEKLGAISRRPNVSADISDAIAATNSKEAITNLLKNDQAQIREETLDQLIDQSRENIMWQNPLVGRPRLSSSAAIRLAEFVADKYLHILEKRRDLDSSTLMRVKKEVHRRIESIAPEISGEAETEEQIDDELNPVQASSSNAHISLAAARRLEREGKLKAGDISSALASGDRIFVNSALAVKADLPIDIIEKIIETRSAKGITAVAWKAGLPMRLATDLQSKLVGIPNADLINPRGGSDYPLSEAELASELAFFTD